ncbi:MAG: FGGY family carbohydrate kinase [Thermodesulfobacteriota bacterium]
MKDCILAIDVGSQSLRACVLDERMSEIARQRVGYTPLVKSRDMVEMDPETLWNAMVTACRAIAHKDRIGSISFSTLCPSLLPMDYDGKPLHPIILHLDRRSHRQAMWALDRVGEDQFLNVAGNLPIPGGISVTSLLWIRDNLPEIYLKKGMCFGHAITFMMKRMTGRFLIDPSNASFTGLYDTVGYGDWDDRLLSPLDIDRRKLPEVIYSTEKGGELGPRSADALGLPARIPVVIGANDTTCATVGAGVVNNGDIMNTSGTVEILALCLEKPLISRKHLLRTHAYPGKWLAMRTVGAGGASFEWFRRNFCREMTKEVFYDTYLRKVLAPGRMPQSRFQPFLAGDRHRIQRKSASFTRMTLNTGRKDLLLGLAHGIISFQLEVLLEWEKHTRLNCEIHHVGGGASEAYTAYKQQMLNNYTFISSGETTLIGAAKLAAGDRRSNKS